MMYGRVGEPIFYCRNNTLRGTGSLFTKSTTIIGKDKVSTYNGWELLQKRNITNFKYFAHTSVGNTKNTTTTPSFFKTINLRNAWERANYAFQVDKSREEYLSLPEIQIPLRQLYKRVHPDLFTDAQVKAVNQTSLTELMSFVESWRKMPNGSPFGALKKKPLTFYSKQPLKKVGEGEEEEKKNEKAEQKIDDGEEDAAQSEGETKTPEFSEFTLTLHYNYPYSTVHKEFARVFKLCGISGKFRVGEKEVIMADDEDIEAFILKKSYIARELAEKEVNYKQLTDDLVQKLAQYNVVVNKSGDSWSYSSYSEIHKACEVLLTAVKGLVNVPNGVDNSKQVLEVLKRFKFELFGANNFVDYTNLLIYLNFEESADQILQFLENVDESKIEEHEQQNDSFNPADINSLSTTKTSTLRQHEKDLQKQVTTLLGVESINVAPQYSYFLLSKEDDKKYIEMEFDEQVEYLKYLLFLNEIKSNPIEIRKAKLWKDKKFRRLSLYVRSFSDPQKLFALSDEGEIYLSNKCTITQICKIIDKLGPRAIELLDIQKEWNKRRDFIIARLGLKDLYSSSTFLQLHSDGLKKERMCIERIEEHLKDLRSLNLSGLELGISSEYAISETGTLWIKWDFQFDKMKKFFLEATKQPPSTEHDSTLAEGDNAFTESISHNSNGDDARLEKTTQQS